MDEIVCLSGSWLMEYSINSCNPSAKDMGQIVQSSAKPWDVPVGYMILRPCRKKMSRDHATLGHVFIWSPVEVNLNSCLPHVISQ